jgi:indole-3-glycerol phosphate synthase
MNILKKILATKREELSAGKSRRSFDELFDGARAVERPPVSFSAALATSETGIIAEFKRRSPSKGFFDAAADAYAVVGGYASRGAAAVSVLTDAEYFGGSLADLVAARQAAANVPLLRKDFIIDPYQICEARIAGADFVLLIAAAMDSRGQCEDLAGFARSLGLETLLEIHGEPELDFVNGAIDAVGVNNRDLTTFVTDVAVSERLCPLLPSGLVKVSESGISSPDTVMALRAAGFDGFLMGENFMRTGDPVTAFADFANRLKG